MLVKDLLTHPNRWLKGSHYYHGRYCLLGAIKKCYPNYNFRLNIENQLSKYIKENTKYGSIAYFNDDKKIKFKDVRAAILATGI